MPEARDRRPSPHDVAAIFARRRAGIIGVLDEEVDSVLFGSTPTRAPGVAGSGSNRGGAALRGGFGASRNGVGRGRGRVLYGSPASGRENNPSSSAQRGRGRASRSVLPSWYPRSPLRNITAVLMAIERRRARLGENEGQQTGSPNAADQLLLDPSSGSVAGAHLEHGASGNSSNPVGVKLRTPVGSKVPKILLDITNESEGDSELLTPQKKLLNSIDTVDKVVRDELQRLKRTPAAKKAEREKRVRTLMSMR